MIDDTFVEILKKLEEFVKKLKEEHNLSEYKFRLINGNDYVTIKGDK